MIMNSVNMRGIISKAKAVNIIMWVHGPIASAKSKDQRASKIDLQPPHTDLILHLGGFICQVSDAVFA